MIRGWRDAGLALLLALCPILGHGETLSSLRTNTRLLISDSGTATSRLRFTDAQVNEFLDECQRESVAATWPILKSMQFELEAGTTYYTLHNTFLAAKRVTWTGRTLPEKSPTNLDSTREWEKVQGTPQNYFITFSSRTKLGIYPVPADSSSTGTIKVEFYAQADDLDDDADVPYNGIREFYSLHHLLSYCAAARLAAIDGQGGLVPFYMQLYTSGLSRLGSGAMARPSYNPSLTPANPGGP